MTPIRLFLLLLLLLRLPAAGEMVVPDALEYTPPDFFWSAKPRNDPGDDPFSNQVRFREFLAKDNSGGSLFRQLNIGMHLTGRTIGKGKRVSFHPVTEEEIKKLMLETVSKRATNSPKVEETTLAGHKAWKVHSVVPMPDAAKDAVFQFESIWVPVHPNMVITLQLVGSSEALLKTVRESLSAVKILPGAAVAPWEKEPKLNVAKDAVRLGILPSEAAEASGKPVVSREFISYFFDGTYIIVMGYEIRVMTSVTYLKSKEPGKFLKPIANDEQPDMTLLQPLTAAEVDALLARHGTDPKGAKLTWTKSKENRWERSDGAGAEYYPERKVLKIAIKEAWEGKRPRQPDE